MRGAILGDIIGSTHEYDNRIDTKDFELFPKGSKFTDDTVLTIAVYDSLINDISYEESFYKWVSKYPNRGYGQGFFNWVVSKDKKPYGSKGNGAAMRVSPVGWYFNTEREVLEEAKKSAEVTHNSKEGIESAQAVAMCIYLSREKRSKEYIKKYIEDNFDYDLSRDIDDIRKNYVHSMRAIDSVPESIICFLQSNSFEDSIRNAISLKGDADTLGCITGSISEAYYGLDIDIWNRGKEFLTEEIVRVVEGMETDDYIDRYGILLEDVLISRERALKKKEISFTDEYICERCGNTKLEKFYATNSKECWEGLCGRAGICIFCNKCMDIVEFELREMN
jgi:ADP-ribosylglycohydrolase